LGCSKTGSGKTAAFAIPILQTLSEDPYGIFCLVLTPTRELAFQIADQFRVLGKPIGLRDAVIVGGMDMMQQSLKLAQRPHIVIATPGRLADHISSTDISTLKKIKFLVLDEADRLLEKTFSEDLEVIFNALPKQRQTLLFSATLTSAMKEIQKLATKKPYFYEAPPEVAIVEELDERYVVMPNKVKECYLVYFLQRFHNAEEKSIIIFTRTCRYSPYIFCILVDRV
jgi:ATP-dependent RNA helicase DDX49/DBP8